MVMLSSRSLDLGLGSSSTERCKWIPSQKKPPPLSHQTSTRGGCSVNPSCPCDIGDHLGTALTPGETKELTGLCSLPTPRLRWQAAGGAGFGCPTCGANLGDQAARPRADTRASLSTGAGRGQRQGNGASASAAAGVATSGNRRETAAERAARVHKILDDALSEPAGTAGARKERTLLECGFAYSAAAKGAAASASASAGRGFGGAADVMGRVGGHGSAPFKPPRAKETATAGASHTWAETPTGGSSGATGWGQHGVVAPFKPPARQSTPAPPERGAGRRHSPQQQEEDYKRPRTA